MSRLPLLALLVALGCQSLVPPPAEEIGLWPDAAGSVDDPRLAALCVDAWELRLAHDPFGATFLGDPRYHGAVPDPSRVGRERRIADLEGLLQRARLLPEPESGEDALTLALVKDHLRRRLTEERLALDEWTVDPVSGIGVEILNVAAVQPVETARQREQLVRRWRRIPGYVRGVAQNHRVAAAEGRVSSETAVREAIASLDAILDTPPMDSPLLEPALGGGRWIEHPPGASLHSIAYQELGDGRLQRDLRLVNLHLREGERIIEGTRLLVPASDDPLSPEERGEFFYDVLTAVETDIYPALIAYRDTLARVLLPQARRDDQPGLMYLGGGDAMYRRLIELHTTLDLSPQEIHEFGLAEVERIRGEIAALGEEVFGTSRVAEIQERLRSDPELFFSERDEVQAKATEALFRAERRMSEFFGRLPAAPCEVLPTPAHEEVHSTIAYYRQPAPDGSRPGRYYVNTYAPDTRPRYDAEVLAYHEAVPGHHLQIAIAQELEGLPLVRRHLFHTAYGEGWALYVERLCDEMGLYSGDLDRFGVLSFDAWRASRLVVDTGIHALGWSRQQAIDYLFENTLLARNNCQNEVDRYIAWPGQALAYKIGQREFLRLRDLAREELGPDFSYPEFHDRVLEKGSLPLELLSARVEDWLGIE